MPFYVIQWMETPANGEPYKRGPFIVEKDKRDGTPWPENAEILAIYDYDTDDWELAEIHYYKEYRNPKPAQLAHSDGWLSPNGIFYMCDYGEHDSLAKAITAAHYSTLEGTYYLENSGWIRIHKPGYIGYTQNKPTQLQMDRLFDLAQLSIDWQQGLLMVIKAYS